MTTDYQITETDTENELIKEEINQLITKGEKNEK